MDRANREMERGRGSNVLNLLGGISGYPDVLFNYEKNEKDIFNIIKEAHKTINIRQALPSFLDIDSASSTY